MNTHRTINPFFVLLNVLKFLLILFVIMMVIGAGFGVGYNAVSI